MVREAGESGALDAAILRLDRALTQLDLHVSGLAARADASNGGLFDHDRSNLAAELDAARGRERELTEAGAQASAAIGMAIAQLREALAEEDEGQDADNDADNDADLDEEGA